ncbi:MAG TPA: toll/interleukin-1 receptor domain-containing protein [Solirubrobacterales bacterium]|nr:toll/interleukin-1 receptor domain-containing protein [Solirubrobacterales bacterium]
MRREIEAFVAHESIQVSQEWQDVLQVGLRTCDAVVALVTPNFKESDWTNQEIGIATAHGKLVVPLRFGGDPHGFFAKYQALTIKGGDEYREIARKLFEAFAGHDLTKQRMADVLVRKFIESGSYDEVRSRFVALKMVPKEAWTQRLAAELREACEENREIKEGQIDWQPAPEVVNNLLASVGI